MKDLAGSVENKKKEFNWYLEKANETEGKALEYSELMKSEVNNVFDGIVASVEAQRNEALQSVSQGSEGDLVTEGDDGGQSGSTR